MQEFQVVSNNFSAEFGHATGGVVNTVTRSGGNDFTAPATGSSATGFERAKTHLPRSIPLEKRHQLGASAGGKIIKDKLFYFLNYEATRRDFPLIASITAPGQPAFDTTGSSTAPCTFRPPRPPRRNAPPPQLPATANSRPCPHRDQELGFGKLDWRPTERHSFSASFNFLRWVSPNGLQTRPCLTTGNGIGNNVNSAVRAKYGRAAWTAIPTNSMVNEFRFGWFTTAVRLSQ